MTWSIRRRVEHFLRQSGMRPTRFGLETIGDPKLVFQMRRGRALRPRTKARILAFLERCESDPEAAFRRRGRRR